MNLKFSVSLLFVLMSVMQPVVQAGDTLVCQPLHWNHVLQEETMVIKQESRKQMKRYALGAVVVVGGLCALIGADSISKFTKGLFAASNAEDNLEIMKHLIATGKAQKLELDALKAPAKSNGFIRGITSAAKTLVGVVMTPVKLGMSLIVLPVATGAIKDVVAVPWLAKQAREHGYKAGMLNGILGITNVGQFIEQETTLWLSFEFVRGYAACLDIYSPRLDLALQQSQHQQFIQLMVEDLGKAAQSQKNPLGVMLKDLISQKRLRYETQAADLQAMHHQAQQLVTQKEHLKQGLPAYVEEQHALYKQNIAMQMNLLTVDIQRAFGFVMSRLQNKPTMRKLIQARIEQTISVANEYITDINQLLTLSEAELYEKGKAGEGLFDKVFDYYLCIQKEFNWFGHYIK